VVAIELDRRLGPVLEETLAECPNVRVIYADAMKTDLRALIETELAGLEAVVCANLPYYITSPMLMHLLESRLPLRSVTVMVQREAARRLCAEPGRRECGAVSAAVWYYAEPKLLFSVSPGSFMPRPRWNRR
jgi:16S rRNA (adenine1518-N6/adenine1519-N6)-dimethyltransferase